MKHSVLIMAIFTSLLFVGASSGNISSDGFFSKYNTMKKSKIKITINSKIFSATLLDNNAAKVFMQMLPLTINMMELNGNEKYFDLPISLPVNSSEPRRIKNGDLMLFGSKTLVLFYKSFSTRYSYTKLGAVDDATGLASALGSENVTVVFEAIK